jgi:hypothetical protein
VEGEREDNKVIRLPDGLMKPRLHYEAPEGSQLIACNLSKEDKTNEVL